MENATYIAKKLGRKWHRSWEDIRQEILIWCIRKGSRAPADDLDEEEYKVAMKKLRSSLYWAGERYCRREKAKESGYRPEDEAFYGLKFIAELLTIYFQTGIEEHAPIGTSDSVRHQKADGAEYGNFLASMLDVEKAYWKLNGNYRQRLEVRYGQLGHLSDDRIASLSQSEAKDLTGMHHDHLRLLLGTTGDQVRHRTGTALRALQALLGGPNPWGGSAARAA